MQTKTTAVQALEQVVRWRCEQLVGSGFAPGLAARVAEKTDYDLDALIELVERGCPPELAVRILAPVEEKSAA
jgi:hypothetical protein